MNEKKYKASELASSFAPVKSAYALYKKLRDEFYNNHDPHLVQAYDDRVNGEIGFVVYAGAVEDDINDPGIIAFPERLPMSIEVERACEAALTSAFVKIFLVGGKMIEVDGKGISKIEGFAPSETPVVANGIHIAIEGIREANRAYPTACDWWKLTTPGSQAYTVRPEILQMRGEIERLRAICVVNGIDPAPSEPLPRLPWEWEEEGDLNGKNE